MDESTEPVQPDEGQGGQAADAPYSEYLNRIPEEVRGQVEPIFKEWDGNTTRRFQEHSEYRKQWEPFESTGVNQLNPQEVQELIQFKTMVEQNPAAVQEWFNNYAQQAGLTKAEQQELEQQAFVDPDVQALVEQQLQQRLSPFEQKFQQFESFMSRAQESEVQQQGQAEVDRQLSELKAKHPDADIQEFEPYVGKYVESDPTHAIQRGYDDYVKLVARIEQQMTKGKLEQPDAAEHGGGTAATPEPVNSLEEAGKLALARLRQSQ